MRINKIFFTIFFHLILFSVLCSGAENDDFDFGVKLYSQDTAMSAEQFEKFIVKYPRSKLLPDAYLWLGQCYQTLEQYDTAIIKFSVISVNYPKYNNLDLVYFNLGIGYYFKNEFENAINYFDKFIQISNSNKNKKIKNEENLKLAEIYTGDCYFNIGAYGKAAAKYSESLKKKETLETAFKLFKSYYLGKQFDEALEISGKYNFAENGKKSFSEFDLQRFYFYAGEIYFAKKNFIESIKFLSELERFQSRPDYLNYILLKISQCFYNTGNIEKTIEYLTKIESTGLPEYANEIPFRIGAIYYNGGKYNEASNYFMDGLKKYPKNADENFIPPAVNSFFKSGRYKDIIFTYENFALKNNKTNLDVLEKTIYAYFTQDKFDEIIRISSSLALTDDNRYFTIKFYEANSYYKQKKYQKCATELKLLLAIKSLPEPLKIKIHKLLGDAYLELEDFKSAEEHFLEIADVEADDMPKDEICAKIGLCYFKQNKIELLEALIKVVYEKYNDSYNMNYLLFVYSKTASDKIKKEYYLNEIAKNSKNPELINNSLYQLALINFDNRQYHTGISNLKKIVSKELEHEKNYLMAAHYFYLNDYPKSLEFLKKTNAKSVESDKYNKLMTLVNYNLKQYGIAIKYAVLLPDKDREDKLFYTAASNFYLNDYKSAAQNFEIYINNFAGSPKFYESLFFYGVSNYKLGEYGKSKLAFLQIENTKKENKTGYKKYLAYLYLIENNIDKSLRTINEYETESQKNLNETDIAEINYIKGQSYFELKNPSKSIEYLNKINLQTAQKAGFLKELYLLKANCNQAVFNYSEANANYGNFSDLSKDTNLLINVNMKILINLSKLQKFNEALEQADMLASRFKLSKSDEIIRIIHKSKAYFQLQKYDETIKFLSENVVDDRDYNIEKMFIISGAYFNKKDYANSNKNYLELLEKYEDNKYAGDIKMAVAANYKLLGDMSSFEKYKLNIINTLPDEFAVNESMFELAGYYYSIEKFDSSVYYLNKIINVSNDRIMLEKSYRQLSNVYYKQGEYAKSIETANLYLKMYQDSKDIDKSEINLILADNYFSTGEYVKSIDIYGKLAPTDYTQYQKCLAFFNMNEYQNCINEANILSSKFPKSQYNADAKFMSAYCHYKKNNIPESVKILSSIYDKILTDNNKITALQIMTEYYFSIKDYKNAIKWLTVQSENKKLSNPVVFYNLSDAYYQIGDYSNAVKNILKIINNSQFESVKQNNYRKLTDCYLKLKDYKMALYTIDLYDNKNAPEFILLKSDILEKTGNSAEIIKICSDYISKITIIVNEVVLKIIHILLDKYKITDKKAYFEFYIKLIETKKFKEKNILAGYAIDLADSYFDDEDYNNSLVYYWKTVLTIEANDFFEYSYFRIIQCYLKLNDTAKAKFQFDNFKNSYPKSSYLNELNKIEVLKK